MTLTVAFACALSCTVLYPLFIGSAWFYGGLGAIITVAASGTLSRLRTLPVAVCLAVSAAGLLVYLNLVFEVRHNWALIIPTPGSLSRLWDLLVTGVSDANKYASPAAERPSLLLLAVGGIGITAIMTDLIAVRLRSTALAGLPLLVLFTVPVTMNAQKQSIGTLVVFCLGTSGYLAMLSADGRERIRMWGRLVSLWRSGSLQAGPSGPGADGGYLEPADQDAASVRQVSGREPGPDTRALAAAGRRVGLASVVLALCVPLIVPGLHPSKLLSSGPGIGGNGGGPGAAVALPDTLDQTLRELQQKTPVKVLSYTTDATKDPPYLQTYVYDILTDSGWQTSDYTAGATQTTTMPPAQGVLDQSGYRQIKTTVTVAGDALTNRTAPTFLALPYPATQVSPPPGIWLADPELMVFSQHKAASALSYQATSSAVDPTIAQLRTAPAPSASVKADLELPSSYQTRALKQIADEHTAGQTSEYAKVNALAAWLSGPTFEYSAAGAPVKSAASLYDFLTKTRLGVCVQSAWAMTVLTRLLGIPARLAGGFTEGTRQADGNYVVRTDDAHAWAQVYFTNYGWINFEATPAGGDGTAQANSYQTSATNGSRAAPPGTGPSGSATAPTKTAPTAGGQANKFIGAGGGSGGSLSARSAGTPWAAIVLAILAAIALACGVIAIVAPPAHRVLSAHAPGEARRRPAVSLASVLLVVAAAAIVGLALYRLLAHTGLDLRAGWATVGIAFGAACAFVFVVPGVARVAIRRWRWFRAGDDTRRAHAVWREFRDNLQDLGLGYAPSEPPRTLAARVTAGLPEPAREAVRRLALAEERASYAARPTGSANLRRDLATARRGVMASVRTSSRWRARLFPASVLTAAADLTARMPDRLAAAVSRRWAERGSTS
jgi:transglutaminase-like putative cysteine protease